MTGDLGGFRRISPQDKWCVHSYYSLCPYAPDGSGRILVSGADPKSGRAQIYILSADGEVLDRFGDELPESSFYHTGCWQTWSSDARYVYYQGGTMHSPEICRYEIATGKTVRMKGDMEGAPPFNEPIISGFLGMLYAAGYADGTYYPDRAPFPFENRDEHGLFEFDITHGTQKLRLSVNDILHSHPDREKIERAESEYKRKTGNKEGFTLMAYCVRWNRKGDRCLFYFGNHCVSKARREPKLCYVFTAKADLSDIRLALDLSFDKTGVHWSFHPDGEHLVGYASHPDNDGKMCLCTVRYDGSDFRMISRHGAGGHPSISPTDYNLLMTDENFRPEGRIVFIDIPTGEEICAYSFPREYGSSVPYGRNPYRICHHPVFSQDGTKVLFNILPGQNSVVCEMDAPKRKG